MVSVSEPGGLAVAADIAQIVSVVAAPAAAVFGVGLLKKTAVSVNTDTLTTLTR